jgi:glycosyltransferase involved in cell wall biosynthesis
LEGQFVRISVVTPNFNTAPYLEDTIKSVIANLRVGDEYFVVDGGSADGSVDIIRRHESAITGWVSEKDAGYADALAKGFARATGDILCWLNSSDLYLSGTLDRVRTILAGQSDLIFGDDFNIDESNRVVFFGRGWVPDLRLGTLYGGWTPLQESCFWRRDLYEKVGGIDPSLKYAADYDLFLRMSAVARTTYVPLAFSAFRRHSGQKSISGMLAYQSERWACRARELRRQVEPKGLNLLKRVAYRSAMSARARLAPWLWSRPDLAGIDVGTLPCAQYWPKT